MKKIVLGIITLFVISGCSALKIVESNAALNAGAAAVQALTISDAQIAELCTEYMAQIDKENTIAPASSEYAQRLNRIMVKFKEAY